MEGASTPDFLWAILMQGHQRKSVIDTQSAIRAAATLGDQSFCCFFSPAHNLWAAQGSYRKHPSSRALKLEDTARVSTEVYGCYLRFWPWWIISRISSSCRQTCISANLANINVYVYGFRYIKPGGGSEREVYLSTLPSPDTSSICKYQQTAMSGIYVKVTVAEAAAQLFQSASYQRGKKWILKRRVRFGLTGVEDMLLDVKIRVALASLKLHGAAFAVFWRVPRLLLSYSTVFYGWLNLNKLFQNVRQTPNPDVLMLGLMNEEWSVSSVTSCNFPSPQRSEQRC